MPRTMRVTETPAWVASAILSMTSRSVREFIFMKMRPGLPALTRLISRSIPRMMRGLRPTGATPKYL